MHGTLPPGGVVLDWAPVAVRAECRHYSTRSLPSGEVVERCRLGANQEMPFACPDGCVFFEPRAGMSAGWTVGEGGEPE